jgi:uncharacterized protein
MIIEGIVTTVDLAGQVNIAPMGPTQGSDIGPWLLRPFMSSRTYANLRATDQAIFHIVDDVGLLARAAIGQLKIESVPLRRLEDGSGWVIVDACRWLQLRVVEWVEEGPRATAHCHVVQQKTQRDFVGWNRAKHAVLEAAILATRTHLIAKDALARDLQRLRPLVDKTGGPQEQEAFELLEQFILGR